MSNRTFCVLLASVMMFFGAAAMLFLKERNLEKDTSVQAASVQAIQEKEEDTEELLLPAMSAIEEEYGASYSEQYGQWCLQEMLMIKTQSGEALYAPVSGVVERIEGMEVEGRLFSAGSRIFLRCDSVLIVLYPVYGVRVFEGSSVTQKSILGSTGDMLTMSAQKDGLPIDPMTVRTVK